MAKTKQFRFEEKGLLRTRNVVYCSLGGGVSVRIHGFKHYLLMSQCRWELKRKKIFYTVRLTWLCSGPAGAVGQLLPLYRELAPPHTQASSHRHHTLHAVPTTHDPATCGPLPGRVITMQYLLPMILLPVVHSLVGLLS